MFTSKLRLIAPFCCAAFGVIVALIEPAFAGAPPTPAPLIGAGLPVIAVLAGGYWLARKLRGPR